MKNKTENLPKRIWRADAGTLVLDKTPLHAFFVVGCCISSKDKEEVFLKSAPGIIERKNEMGASAFGVTLRRADPRKKARIENRVKSELFLLNLVCVHCSHATCKNTPAGRGKLNELVADRVEQRIGKSF